MQELEASHFYDLDAHALALRIDTFFKEDQISRYGAMVPITYEVSAIAIYASKSIQALDEPSRKRALLLFYRSRFQSTLCSQYAGIENLLVHGLNENRANWLNPHVQILAASTRQAGIVSARISFECLMEFVYFVENGRLLPGKKSKIGTFRKWLCSPENRFGWLVFYLIIVHRFDREHRTPEIHGTSYIAIDALCCQEFPRQDAELDATNLNLNIWRSILEVLNDGENISYFHGSRDELVFQDFFNWKHVDLNVLWKKYVANE